MRKTFGKVSFTVTALIFSALLVFDWLGISIVYRIFERWGLGLTALLWILIIIIVSAIVRSIWRIARWLIKRYHFITVDDYNIIFASAVIRPKIELQIHDIQRITFAANKTRPMLIAETAYNKYEIPFGGNYLDLAQLYTTLTNAGVTTDLTGQSARLVTMDQGKLKQKIILIYIFVFLLIGFLAYRANHRMHRYRRRHHHHRYQAQPATTSEYNMPEYPLQMA